jgi:hypothetical protein
MAKSKKATDHQGELRRYEVLIPIKFAGRVTKRGPVELPIAVGDELAERGVVAPIPDASAIKPGSQVGANPNNPREESGRSAAAGEAGGSASSTKSEAAAPKQAPAGNAKQPATKAAGKAPSKKAK